MSPAASLGLQAIARGVGSGPPDVRSCAQLASLIGESPATPYAGGHLFLLARPGAQTDSARLPGDGGHFPQVPCRLEALHLGHDGIDCGPLCVVIGDVLLRTGRTLSQALPSLGAPRSLTLVSNRTSVGPAIEQILLRARLQLGARAYIHQYERYGVGAEYLAERLELMQQVVDDYERVHRAAGGSSGAVHSSALQFSPSPRLFTYPASYPTLNQTTTRRESVQSELV